MVTVDARGVYFDWPSGPALVGVSCRVAEGEMVVVVGPNGAGKSTLLRILSGYLKPVRGGVYVDGRPLASFRRRDIGRRLAFVPQYSESNLPYGVAEFVALGRYPHMGPFRPPRRDDRAAVAAALAATEMTAFADRRLGELSGGEFQRAVLARAIAQEPSLLLLDEPMAHLDLSHEARMVALLRRLNAERRLTVIAALHDLNLAAANFGRVIVLSEGRVVADGPPAAVFTEELLGNVYRWPVRVVDAAGRRLIFPVVTGKESEVQRNVRT